MAKLNLVGKRFGRLLVIKELEKRYQRKIVWRCQCDCGNIIEVPTTYLTTGDTSSCGCLKRDVSREAMKKISKNNLGSNHYNWKGGVSTENQKIRSSPEYVQWRNYVFASDEYKCRKCKTSGKRLNAHHIRSFAKYPSLRFDVNNGITFCEDCHIDFHSLYGRNADYYDLMEYLYV